MVSSSSTSQKLAGFAAIVAPLLVFAAFAQGLTSFRDTEDRTADENAGLVFNGRVNDRGAVAAMDNAMRVLNPQVVLVGPSYANTDVRRDTIARHLGIQTDDVAMLSVPMSVGSHWYAVLKYRVFMAGYRPKLVVVISGMQSMLLNTPLSESSFTNLESQLDDPEDPEVRARLSAETHLGVGHLREQRGKVRARWFEFLRNVGPWSLMSSGNNANQRMRKEEVRARLDRVFDASKVDMSLYSGASSPVVTGGGGEEARDLSRLSLPEDSFMPLITTLAADHGARVVWVRPPMSPDIPEAMNDVVPDGVQQAVVEVIRPLGGSLLDMRRVPMNVEMFANEDHMNSEGSRRFSEALGLALARMDALYPEAAAGLPPLDVPDPTGVFTGDLAQEEAAAGPGLWVAPGTQIRFQIPAWSRERGVFSAALAVEQLTSDAPGRPRWTVNGVTGPLKSIEPGNGWIIWRGEGVIEVADEAVELVVHNPKNGSFFRVTGLALGRRNGRQMVVGTAEDVDGARVRLFSRFEREGDQLVDRSISPDFSKPPGSVPNGRRPALDIRNSRVARLDTHEWGFLSDEFLMGESAFGSRCSPLRVTENGARLPLPNEPCADVHRLGGGRTCHSPESIFFTASDGSDPVNNGRSYALELDEGRRCDGAVWLYPLDAQTTRFPAEELAALPRGATHLTIGARYLMKRKTEIQVVLRVDGEVRLERTVQGQAFWQDDQVWPLDPPIAPGTEDVTIEITNLDRTFYLIEEVALSEGPFVRPSRYAL